MTRGKIGAILIGGTFLLCASQLFFLYQDGKLGIGGKKDPAQILPALQPDRSTAAVQFMPASSPAQFAALCLALAGAGLQEPQYKQFAALMSEDYRKASGDGMGADVFKARDLLAQLKPQIDQLLQDLKTRYFVVDTQVFLGHYSFEKQSFALQDSMSYGGTWTLDGTRARFERGGEFRLKATNKENYSALKVTDENRARQVEALPRSAREFTAKVYLFAQELTPDAGGAVVKAEILRVELHDKDNRKVAEI